MAKLRHIAVQAPNQERRARFFRRIPGTDEGLDAEPTFKEPYVIVSDVSERNWRRARKP